MSWNIVIISGGQTGAGRAALDFALDNGIPYGGWCPKGRRALDGPLDGRYALHETGSEDYAERAELNVRESEALVVFTLAQEATDSSKQIMRLARKIKQPYVHFHKGILAVSEKLLHFMAKHRVSRLHIMGSSEETEPGIYNWVSTTLHKAQATLKDQQRKAPHQARVSFSSRV